MSIPFDPTTAKALGARIRAQRIAAGISLDDFATATGVTAAEVSLIEDGATRPTAVHWFRSAGSSGSSSRNC